MATFLLINLLLLLQPAFQLSESGSFLIYNENLKLCVQLQQSRSIILDYCNNDNEGQHFKWVSDYQLLNVAVKLCLAVPSKTNLVPVTLSPCNRTIELQKWECRNDTLLALKEGGLFLHPANGRKGKVILSQTSTMQSIWKIYGTKDSLCSKGYEALYTLNGNAFGAPCVFPFKYMNKQHAECIRDDKNGKLWCGTTPDVDKDALTGYCPLKDDHDEFFWTRNRWTGDLYQINTQSALTWYQARTSCQQQNAELVSITELHEQIYLSGLTSIIETDYWIGLNSLDFESGWQWICNHPLRYLNWSPGSPSLETEKMCGSMESKSGKWENIECDQKLGYICKKQNSSIHASVIPSDDFKPVKCLDGWVAYADHCYHLNRGPKAWKSALLSCRKDGGDLISIHNIEEYSFVISQLGYKATDLLWLGLNDQKTQMYFEWSDGTPVVFTKWQRGEPTHINNVQEDCVIMSGENGHWADYFCEEELGYICKKEPLASVPEEAETADPKCQKGWKRHGLYCYFIGQTSVIFSEAKNICAANKGFLTSVEDRYEQAYLTSLIGLHSEKMFWIGLSDIEQPGTFKWTSGDNVLFTHWNSEMPGQQPGCVAMRTGTAAGLWDVVSCEEKAAFLCKQWAEGVTPPPALVTTPPPPCPEGWSPSPLRSVCFKAFKGEKYEKKTWFEAHDFCKEIGGDLPSIHGYKEENVLIAIYYGEDSWMGLNPMDNSSGLTWTDGSPIKRGAPLNPEPRNTLEDSFKILEDGWIGYENNEYYFSNITLHAEEARKFCRAHDGDLVVIESESERKFLRKYSALYGSSMIDPYIGLIVGLDRKFGWVDGSPVTYVAWAPDEPNFKNNDEYCVVLYLKTGFWNDINCGALRSFICERHNSSVRSTIAPTSPAPQGGCAEGWLLFENKCFKIFGFDEKERKGWYDARTDCINKGGNLANIPSKTVQAFLTMHLKSTSADTWIGLNDVNWRGRYLWTDGRIGVYYTNWAKGFPNNKGSCVFMMNESERLAGNWRDGLCTAPKSYICQTNTDTIFSHSEPTIPASGYILYGNSSYSLVSPKMTWEEARKKCKSENAELASILTSYIQSFVWLQVLKYGEPVWIGLNSNMTNEAYKWVNNWRLFYSNWAAEEPKQKIACVYLDLDGHWKTGACNEKHFFACEQYHGVRPTETPEVPGRCPTLNHTQLSWIPFQAHCYLIYPGRDSRPSASLKCTQLGGTLTSIEDLVEQEFLKAHTEQLRPMHFWIGLTENVDGKWMWEDNTEVDFVNWKGGQLKEDAKSYYHDGFLNFQRQCVFMNGHTGEWSLQRCYYSSEAFICKTHKIIEETTIKEPTKPKDQEAIPGPSQSTLMLVVMLVILILIGVGITIYILYKRSRKRQQIIANAGNSSYRDSMVILQNDPVNNREWN
ncbi:macrophage mannose receptor 1-like [Elgaria multicarinata webbii]|uniref:macrophage mannose receptor 1-like n=1 Tax=Elgaria multicarinata webbii TaxID=159646 RepID=UPI002FCD0EF6